ncbi:MAG: hypothetical protein QOD29_5182 [Alphaproteobacteria bacterium]|jgi:hypothetical protein|nr:hypothetical protein [Alphaproteobacteria bacterium]
MRRLGLVTVLPSSRVLSSAEARADGPWCARYGTGLEGSNCGFYSFEQCQAAISGNGGRCSQNLLYGTDREARRRQQRH